MTKAKKTSSIPSRFFKKNIPPFKMLLFGIVALALAVVSYTYLSKVSHPLQDPMGIENGQIVVNAQESMQAEVENLKYQLMLTQNQLSKLETIDKKKQDEIKLYKKELSQYKTRFGDLKSLKPTSPKPALAQEKAQEAKPTKVATPVKTIPKVAAVAKKKKGRKIISVNFSEDGTFN
jgi:hypothetical protein